MNAANNTLCSAHRHHSTTAPGPGTNSTQYTPHREGRIHKSMPHRERRSCKARDHGTTSSTDTPPQPQTPASRCPNTTAQSTRSVTITLQHNQCLQATQPAHRTAPP